MKPIEDIIKAAEQGDACTQYRIGMMYLNGEGVDKDQDVAYHWLLKSAKQGYAEAQYEVGMILLNDRTIKINPDLLNDRYHLRDEPVSLIWEPKVRVSFQERVGEIVSTKRKEAFEWIMKAAQQGLPQAEFIVGYMYEGAFDIRNNEEDAFDTLWYDRKMNKAMVFAIHDEQKAFHWYHKAAEHNHPEAQYRVAVRYEKGNGTDANVFRALWWYLKAAQKGQKEAVFRMAKVYNARGRKADVAKIWNLYQQAKEKAGTVEAMIHLGELYESGKAVGDFKQAYDCYKKALDAGYKKAYYPLGNLYYQGKGVERDLEKAFECYMFGAKNYDIPEAQYALGRMYEKGEVAKQNMKEAIRWYKAAAKSGNPEAEEALERLKPNWKKLF